MSNLAATTLMNAVRPAVIAKRLGQLAVVLASLTVVPLFVSLVTREPTIALRYGLVVLALAIAGVWLSRRDAPGTIQLNEGLTIGALAFTLTPLLMSYPLMGSGLGFIDALFECVSGITTTGLSTLDSVDGRSFAFLFERAWLQWIGGLGIVVLAVALLAGDDIASRRLVESAVSGESLGTSTRLHARRCLVSYTLLTVAAIAVLWLSGWSTPDALLLALAAISTGGFSPHDASLAAAPLWPARLAVIGVALLGAVSLPLYHSAWRRRWGTLARDPELRLLLLSIVLGSGLLMLLMSHAQGRWTLEQAAQALTMAMSAQTTSGFASMPPAQLDSASQLVLMVCMTVGGSVGSTAGGIKLLRLWMLLRMGQFIVRRTLLPSHAVQVTRLHDRVLDGEAISAALFLVLLFVATVLLSWLPFLVAGHPPMASLFEVVSAVGTVGLSSGVTQAGLHPMLKGVLCIDMLMGRVEFVAVLVVLYPRNWFGRRRAA